MQLYIQCDTSHPTPSPITPPHHSQCVVCNAALQYNTLYWNTEMGTHHNTASSSAVNPAPTPHPFSPHSYCTERAFQNETQTRPLTHSLPTITLPRLAIQHVEPRKAFNQHNYFVARTNRHRTTDFTTISTHRKRQLNDKRRKGAEDSMCI